MRKLDRYIIKEFLMTFVVIFLSSSVLFIVIDVIDNLSKMLRHGASLQQAMLYYSLRIPYLLTLTAPVIMLLTGLFLMNTLSKFNESIAVRAAGISIKRMLFPLMIVGFIVSILIGLFSEFVLPHAEERRAHLYQVEIKKGKGTDRLLRTKVFFKEGDHTQNYIAFFNGHKDEMKIIDKTVISDDFRHILEKSEATSAQYKANQWDYEQLYQREFNDGEISKYSYFKNKVADVLDITPKVFIRTSKASMSMNFFELRDYISRLKHIHDDYTKELVDLHFKVSYPLVNFIILFFSFPIVSSSTRNKNRGYIFMMGLAVCFAFLVAAKVSRSLGYSGVLSPMVSAWAPDVIFFSIGLYFLHKSEV